MRRRVPSLAALVAVALAALPPARALLALLACGLVAWEGGGARAQAPAAPEIEVSAAWTRAASQGGTGAGFMRLRNRGTTADRIVSASSPVARAVELHAHMREGDVMRMRPVPAIELPAGQEVRLAPGGLHLMMVGLNRPLRQGERVPVTLTLGSGGTLAVELEVLAAGARGPASHGAGGGAGMH